MKINYRYLFFFCCILIISCKSSRDQTNILYYTTQSADDKASRLQESITNQGWVFSPTTNPLSFSDDSLAVISAIVLHVSDINGLDHRAIPKIKRYLEVLF